MEGLPELLDHLASEFARKRVRVDHFLQDFDRLRVGFVTADQFRRGMSQLGVFMTPGEIDSIIRAFTEDRAGQGPMVNYRNFARSFEPRDLEKTPTKEIGEVPRGRRHVPVPGTAPVDAEPDEQEAMHELFHRLRTAVRVKRLDIIGAFRDFDRMRRGTCTLEQFRTGLNVFGRVSAKEFSLLQRAFEMTNGHVSYRSFNEMLTRELQGETDHPGIASAAAKLPVPKQVPKVGSANDVDLQGLHRRLAAWVTQRRQRLNQFFRDFDPTRKGIVTRGQFINVVHITAGFPMNEHEMDALTELYSVNDRQCEYKRLCEVLAQFTELAVAPQGEGSIMEDPEQEAAVQKVIGRLRTTVHADRVNIAPSFHMLDRTRKGLITKSQFDKALRQLGRGFADITPMEMRLLTDKFEAVDRPDLVKWTSFVHAMEEAKGGLGLNVGAQRVRGPGGPLQRKPVPSLQPEADIDDILSSLRDKVFSTKIRLEEYLADHDRVRRGYIPAQQFRSTLDSLGFKFSEKEFSQIQEAFRSETRTNTPSIQWRKFCDYVNSVFDDRGAMTPSKRGAGATILSPRALQVVKTLATQSRAQHANPLERFYEDDPRRSGRLGSMRAFNASFNLLYRALNQQDRDHLFRAFGHPDREGFDYKRFSQALDKA